jgi:hypothetical protein
MTTIPHARAALAGAMMLTGTAASATTYTYQTISVPNSVQTDPVAINDAGKAAGQWYDSHYGAHGYVFSGGTVTTFDAPGSAGTYVDGMNNKGEIVGTFLDASYNYHGFIRSAKGKFTTIDVPGSSFAGVDAINDNGVVAVAGQDANGYEAIYTLTKGVLKLIIDNQQTPVATSINSQGSVAGYNSPPHGYETAFLYANGTLTTLPITQYSFSAAFAINKHNEVVGQAANGGTEYGFIYSPKGRVTYIGPAGSTDSFNLGINDAGVIAGVSYDSSYNSVGYTYKKGVFSTLSVAGGSNVSANAINNAGQVVGNYLDANNVIQTFLATPQQ